MDSNTLLKKLKDIIKPFIDDEAVLAAADHNTHIIDELQLNSAWLVDFIIKIEDAFDIEVSDDDADSIQTLGDAVGVIQSKIENTATA